MEDIVLINFPNIFDVLIYQFSIETDIKVINALELFSNKMQGLITIALPKKFLIYYVSNINKKKLHQQIFKIGWINANIFEVIES